eukprot:gene57472-78750_t
MSGGVDSSVAALVLQRAGVPIVGAFVGVGLTLLLARGAQQTPRLLLAGVVVGVVLSALGDLVSTVAPEALRGKQVFMLGTTGFLGWASVGVLTAGLLATLPVAWRLARVLDALTLGEDSARSLGLALARWRLVLVAVLALIVVVLAVIACRLDGRRRLPHDWIAGSEVVLLPANPFPAEKKRRK